MNALQQFRCIHTIVEKRIPSNIQMGRCMCLKASLTLSLYLLEQNTIDTIDSIVWKVYSLVTCYFVGAMPIFLAIARTNQFRNESKLNSVLTPVTNKLRYKMEMIFRGNSPAQFKWELIGTFLLHSPFRVYFIDALETLVPLGRSKCLRLNGKCYLENAPKTVTNFQIDYINRHLTGKWTSQ